MEFKTSVPLSFVVKGSLVTGTLTNAGTYLTTTNFTGSGSFNATVVPTVNTANNCGSYANPSIQLAVLALSLDNTVSC